MFISFNYNYDINNWYWQVDEFPTEIFSSASLSYIDPLDSAYQAWLTVNQMPYKTETGLTLSALIVQQYVPRYLNNGIQIVSTNNALLNATYGATDNDTNRISSIATGIAAGRGLPGGGSTFYYADNQGTLHEFNQTEFLNFASSIETFIYNLRGSIRIICQHGIAQIPSQPVNIDTIGG